MIKVITWNTLSECQRQDVIKISKISGVSDLQGVKNPVLLLICWSSLLYAYASIRPSPTYTVNNIFTMC